MFRSEIEQEVAAASDAVRRAVGRIDPDLIPAGEATRIFEELDQIVRAATAGRTLLARRVEDSLEWKRKGYRSAEEYLAATSGRSLGAARTEMETSKALQSLPATRAQMLDGTLSPDQGAVIAGAAAHNPGAEQALIAKAGRSNLQELREEAQRARAAADTDPEATHRRIHRARRVTRFTDAEGARHLRMCGPVDQMAVFEAELDRLADVAFRSSGKTGPVECREAHVFDAAIALARRSAGGGEPDGRRRSSRRRPDHLALLRLDIEALWRGHVEGDELCEVTGLGPIPVAVARRLLGDAVLKLVITKGDAVAHVTSLTRGPTQAMRYALLWTSPTCSAEGCTRTIVEHDHVWGAEYRTTRHTRLDELDRLCHTHHDLHTVHSWALVRGTGKRPMVPPDHPSHPANAPPTSHATPHGPRAGPPPDGERTHRPASADHPSLFGSDAA
jgi:hypothetical protein